MIRRVIDKNSIEYKAAKKQIEAACRMFYDYYISEDEKEVLIERLLGYDDGYESYNYGNNDTDEDRGDIVVI